MPWWPLAWSFNFVSCATSCQSCERQLPLSNSASKPCTAPLILPAVLLAYGLVWLQLLEAKHGLTIRASSPPAASITYQCFFNFYRKIAGMTVRCLSICLTAACLHFCRHFVVAHAAKVLLVAQTCHSISLLNICHTVYDIAGYCCHRARRAAISVWLRRG